MTELTRHTANVFTQKLANYKKIIDSDIDEYSKQLQKEVLQQYGANARLEIDAFLSILGRGGKRIRGSLVLLGYEMCGGRDTAMIVQAARAIEMLHAYILIIDDIQDRSVIRRGGPAAHTFLADYHNQRHLGGTSEHFGMSIALNSALAGAHAAQTTLINLDIDEEVRLKVLAIVNKTMMITAHGQTNDIMNEVGVDVTMEDVERVLEWKTAHYTFLNPLCVGMTLAGADSGSTEAITDYAMHAGKAFQITDDILGVYGSEFESGKSPMDDIKEGKRTLLTVFALEKADAADKNFLIQMLGNYDLTPVEFERCKEIIDQTGALSHAQKIAKDHMSSALSSLEKHRSRWSEEGVDFLRSLALYILDRQS